MIQIGPAKPGITPARHYLHFIPLGRFTYYFGPTWIGDHAIPSEREKGKKERGRERESQRGGEKKEREKERERGAGGGGKEGERGGGERWVGGGTRRPR